VLLACFIHPLMSVENNNNGMASKMVTSLTVLEKDSSKGIKPKLATAMPVA